MKESHTIQSSDHSTCKACVWLRIRVFRYINWSRWRRKFNYWLVMKLGLYGKSSMNRHHSTSTGKCISLLSSRQSLVLVFCHFWWSTKIGKWTLAVSCMAWGVVVDREVWVQPPAELQAHLPKAELYLLAGERLPNSISEHVKRNSTSSDVLAWGCSGAPAVFLRYHSLSSILVVTATRVKPWLACNR